MELQTFMLQKLRREIEEMVFRYNLLVKSSEKVDSGKNSVQLKKRMLSSRRCVGSGFRSPPACPEV